MEISLPSFNYKQTKANPKFRHSDEYAVRHSVSIADLIFLIDQTSISNHF